ncbi:prephenate dehydratase domain-containing protein [Streptomyces sp. CC224B]|uniref:prephenate dehydratase domain-containing protein n=1 Tax=Streptomyces sp. CC224B TaxID=3044571 RepID=UPI0024A9395E|nr:prephenate dehydratase domain-containing protein [Streptomyces sp. CC224B]
MTLPNFLSLLRPGSAQPEAIGTLGPPGTSSEVAARRYAAQMAGLDGPTADIHLFDTYEQAGDALLAREVSHIVVANAYKGINPFYMDPDIELAGVFVMDTPLYGIAVRRGGHLVPDAPTIASHPAPEPIIAQLMPRRHETYKVIHHNSTSAAARAAVEGTADLALTTVPAAQLHGLEFISRTRPIRMVWSVFGKAAHAPGTAHAPQKEAS